MTDIPEHLIKAAFYGRGKKWRTAEERIARVLAALRPEDAHLVPAWGKHLDNWVGDIKVLMRERDEARDEQLLHRVIDGLKAERDEARAEAADYRDRLFAGNEDFIHITRKLDAEIERLRHNLTDAAMVVGRARQIKAASDSMWDQLRKLSEEAEKTGDYYKYDGTKVECGERAMELLDELLSIVLPGEDETEAILSDPETMAAIREAQEEK